MKVRKALKETVKQRAVSDDPAVEDRIVQRNVKRLKKEIDRNKTNRKAALAVLKQMVVDKSGRKVESGPPEEELDDEPDEL